MEQMHRGYPVAGFTNKFAKGSWQEQEHEKGRQFPIPLPSAERVLRDSAGNIVYGEDGQPRTNTAGFALKEMIEVESVEDSQDVSLAA